jgi:hypothetical protein
VGIRCADLVTPSTRNSRHYFADSGGRSVGIVHLRTKATEFSLVYGGHMLFCIAVTALPVSPPFASIRCSVVMLRVREKATVNVQAYVYVCVRA